LYFEKWKPSLFASINFGAAKQDNVNSFSDYAFLSRTKFAEVQLSIKNVRGNLQNFVENLRVVRPLVEFHEQNFAVF